MGLPFLKRIMGYSANSAALRSHLLPNLRFLTLVTKTISSVVKGITSRAGECTGSVRTPISRMLFRIWGISVSAEPVTT